VKRSLLELLAEHQELGSHGLGQRLGRAGAERDPASLCLLFQEGEGRALTRRRVAHHQCRGLPERPHPLRTLVDRRGGHHQDRGRGLEDLLDRARDAFRERLRPAALQLGLPQHHQTALGEHRKRANRIQQLRPGAAHAIEPIEVEFAGPAGQNRLADRPGRVVAQKRLAAGQEIGGTKPARFDLPLELGGRHGVIRS
jgi:hypothetical protein